MAQGRYVAYYRVSTDKQGLSGLGLEAQRTAVVDYLNGGRWTLAAEFTEVESGKNGHRPKLQEALRACKKLKATLIIAKLDRLSRNLAFIANLMESGVEFVAVDNPHANKLTIHILAAVAEDERERISRRTKEALAAAKARGVRLGGGDHHEQARAAWSQQAAQRAANVLPVVQEIQAAGIGTLAGIATALNARGIKTSRGGEWQPAQVQRVLARAK